MTSHAHEQKKAKRATADRSLVERADARITAAVAPIRHSAVVRATSVMSEIADQPPLVALSAAVAVAGLATRNPRLARAGLRMLASHALATFIKGVIKDNVDRSRPRKLIEEGEYAMEAGDSDEGDLRSFPSGHTAGGTAVVRALKREYPGSAAPTGTVMTLIASALVPKQAHFPSDIVAGAAIGWASEAIVNFAWRRVEGYLPKALPSR